MIRLKVFAEGVAEQIKEYLPPAYTDVECKVMEKRGNNRHLSIGVVFIRAGEILTPVISVEPFYEAVRNGAPLESIMQGLSEMAVQSMNLRSNIPSQLNEYDDVKKYLGVRLVNTRANRNELNDLPHIEIEDLSLIPVIRFPLPDKSGYESIKITENIRKMWGVSAEQMFEQAWENEEHPRLQAINQFISFVDSRQELFEIESASPEITKESMFMLTNQRGTDGAALIAFPGVMEKLDELFPEGFFIVPSSIHETLILPKWMDDTKAVLKYMGNMVRDINQWYTKPTDILSDRIYEYDKESGKIRQVPESVEKERGRRMEL